MSCLMLSELSLSDQVAVQQSFAAAIERKYSLVCELVTLLASPAAVERCIPPAAPAVAGESIPFPVMEPAA